MRMFDYRLEHIMSFTARLGDREVIGPVPGGLRVNVRVTGGEVSGPTLSVRLRSVGGDWLTIRPDGVAMLDVRFTIETADGALIYVTYTGSSDWGEDGYDDALAGAAPAQGTPIHITPRFHTAHAAYLWLNRIHCLGIGQSSPNRDSVRFDVYAVR
jgi:hypothetical protein